ncbi:MAG: transcriptional regulator [Woeseiaceae bacterium]|nr:transcriptional regulator [Woeseiaceae bacterium]
MSKAFQLGEWQVFPLEGKLVSGDRVERLRPRAMDVLVLLARAPGEVVERDTILGEVWGRTAVTDEPLTATVGELRRVLGDRRGANRHIETIPKRGYRLIAPVRPLDSGAPLEAASRPLAGGKHPADLPAPRQPPLPVNSPALQRSRSPRLWPRSWRLVFSGNRTSSRICRAHSPCCHSTSPAMTKRTATLVTDLRARC